MSADPHAHVRLVSPKKAGVSIVVLLAGAYAAWSMLFMWRHRDVFPIYDTLTAEVFLRYLWEGWNPAGLFEWYANEHRPAFPMIVFAVDHFLFGATGPLSLLAMYASALTLALLSVSAVPRARFGAGHAAVGAVAAVMMFWPGHWENLVWPSQLQIYAALLAGVAALIILVRTPADQPPGWARSVGIGALLFVSCFSFAFGFVLAAAVLMVTVLRFGFGRAAMAGGAALIGAVGIYAVLFWGRDQFGTSAGNLAAPGKIVLFVLRYVGAPIGAAFVAAFDIAGFTFPDRSRLTASTVFGVAAVAVFACIAISIARAWRAGAHAEVSPYRWVALALGLFVFGSGLITAAARLNYPETFPIDTLRYYVGTSCFWIAILAWLTFDARVPRAISGAVLAATAITFLVSSPAFLDDVRAHAAADRKAGVAAMSRMSEVWPMFWLPDLVPDLYARFEREGALFYERPWAKVFGKAVGASGLKRDDAACAGAVDATSKVAGIDSSFQLSGTFPKAAAPNWLVISDARGFVVGYGAAQRIAGEGQVPWVAFARDTVLPLSVDAVVTDDTLCRIGTAGAAEGPQTPSLRQPYRTDFAGAAVAVPPDPQLQCPANTERVRWVDGRLLCMPMR